MQPPTIHKRWRPWLRFSLRALMLAMTVVCVFLGWLGYHIHRARVQRAAVTALANGGHYVTYDWQHVNGSNAGPVVPAGATWLREWIGNEYFQEVVKAEVFVSSDDQRKLFATLARLDSLRVLHINGDVDQRHLGALRGLSRLESVRLNSNIDDKSLEQLGQLQSLKSLDLRETNVTDRGIWYIISLQSLESLDLSRTRITDKAMPAVGRLRALRSLNLDDTYITDVGVAHLDQLHELRTFSALDDWFEHDDPAGPPMRLGDKSLQSLARLKKLTNLSIGPTFLHEPSPPAITAAGFAAALKLPLTDLALYHVMLTDEDLAALDESPALQHVLIAGIGFTLDKKVPLERQGYAPVVTRLAAPKVP